MDHAPDTTAAASNASNYLRAIFHCLICHAPRGDCILGDRCSKVKGTLQALVGDRSQVLAAENAILCEPIQRLLEHWLDCSVGRQEPPCLICSEVYAQLQAPERTQEALLTDTDAITSAFDPTHSTCAPQRSVSAELAGGRGGRSIAALTYMLQTEQPQHTTCNLSSVENGSQLAAGSQAGNTANSGCSSVSCTNSDAAMAEITTCLIQALLTKPEVAAGASFFPEVIAEGQGLWKHALACAGPHACTSSCRRVAHVLSHRLRCEDMSCTACIRVARTFSRAAHTRGEDAPSPSPPSSNDKGIIQLLNFLSLDE